MAKRLFVGGLSYGTTEDALRQAFAQAGTVQSATVIIDKVTGRSKGFGFIEMSTDEESQKAIELLNGKDLDGRTITVNEARPREPRPGGDFPHDPGHFGRGGGGGRGGRGGRGFGGGRPPRY